MKLKVLAYTFSVPLLWATILLLQIIVPDFGVSRSVSSAVLVGLLIGSLIGRFFLDSKYLTDLLIEDERITLTYLTPLARKRQITIRFLTLADIKMKKRIFLIRDFGSIKLFSKDNQITFYLLSSDSKQAAEQLTQSFTASILQSRT
jgi:hypothetical protein